MEELCTFLKQQKQRDEDVVMWFKKSVNRKFLNHNFLWSDMDYI